MRHVKYPALKAELKVLASELKEWKQNRKLIRRTELKLKQWQVQDEIDWRKFEFRHKHIAYCMLNGRKYEQIENYCRVAPNFSEIDRIMEKHEQKTICASA